MEQTAAFNTTTVSEEKKEENVASATTSTSTSLTIGGIKGHVKETIQGATLRLFAAFRWKMIPKCTGRYTCRDHKLVSHLTPKELLAQVVQQQQQQGGSDMDDPEAVLLPIIKQYAFSLGGRTDLILVLPLDEAQETGIITYVKKEEAVTHYVHTLNAPSGFQRKLRAIGIISLSDKNVLPREESSS